MDVHDPYDHNAPHVLYIKESIPTLETRDEFEQLFLEGCQCTGTCLKDECACILKSAAFYETHNAKTAVEIQERYTINLKDTERPVYECNGSCKCYGSLCGHRLVQLGPRHGLTVKECPPLDDQSTSKRIKLDSTNDQVGRKGLGLFTLEDIPSGRFVCEYAGEIIDETEAKRRFRCNTEQNKMNYIFCILEHFGAKTIKTYIDPTVFGNIGRYINHSCSPNCLLVPVRVNSSVPKLCIFTQREINKNEEITYDYGMDRATSSNDPEVKLKRCLCGAENCRKFIPFCNYI
ncbi:probable histone-lysine N-methyltransferase set-23 [Agrilus planipennis]|uniref:Probable histone-lysine N-methyltransferase set-23 n=1 Tax=Agrilus planipennis TaxID=224129 RepID=A0A1W4XG45_AGRPL|nr:probable histone-lysine N-methyltransferase set-23 [Agrilus planipennis]